ncbi:CHAT domain-containing WD40 repeat protein [Streptomyces sp. NPDC001492]
MADLKFRLDLVEAENDWVIVCTSPYGGASTKIRAPFSSETLRTALSEVEKALIRSSSPVITRRASVVERTTRQFGERLTGAVLSGDVRLLFERCREQARAKNVPLRVLLAPVGPNLSRIPWEFAVDPSAPDAYLALREPLVRSPQLMEAAPPLPLNPPLRVLGVLSRPTDLPSLEAEREREQITRALGGMAVGVAVEWLPDDSWHALADAVRNRAPHVLHFVGHGGFDEETDSGYLELTADDGTAMHVSGTDLGTLVREVPQLRLVVLNACESATCGNDGLFTSTAARIIREGVPAVVAMQYEITDPAALAFASSFYTGIAKGLPVDRAMTRARETVKMTFAGTLEWATPVLFLGSDEPRLFAVPERPAPAKAVDPPPLLFAPEAPDDPEPMTAAGTQPLRPHFVPPPPTSPPKDWQSAVRDRVTSFFSMRTAPSSLQPEPSVRTVPLRPDRPPSMSRASFVAADTTGEQTVPSPPEGLHRIRVLPPLGPCCDFVAGPQDLLALACADGAVRVIGAHTAELVGECSFPQGGRPVRLAWSPWPRHVASLHENGSVVVWDVGGEIPLRVIPGKPGETFALAFSSDGRWLATAGRGRFQVYDHSGTRVRDLPVDPTAPARSRPEVGALAFAPGDRHLLLASSDGAVRQLDVQGHLVRQWPHSRPVTELAVAERHLVTGGLDGRIRVWSWSGRLHLRVHESGRVLRVALSPDAALIAVVAEPGGLVVRDAVRGHPAPALRSGGHLLGVGFLGEGRGLVTGDQDGVVEQWQLPGTARGDH